MEKQLFVIWSMEHGSYWGHASHGYVRAKSEAGRYSYTEAAEIVTGANGFIRDNEPPHEAMIPVNE